MKRINARPAADEKRRHHWIGGACCKWGHGEKKMSLGKIVLTLVVGIALGLGILQFGSISMELVMSYISMLLLVCILCLLLDTRKIVLNSKYKK